MLDSEESLPLTALAGLGEIRWARTGPEMVVGRFPATSASVPLARTWVCLMMAKLGCLEDSGTAALLVGELAANAVRHADTDELMVRLDFRDGFEAAVHDRDFTMPQRRPGDPWSSGGRGLRVVARMADSWGVREVADGKWVWFRLSPDPFLGFGEAFG